jgi:hypothetical protein
MLLAQAMLVDKSFLVEHPSGSKRFKLGAATNYEEDVCENNDFVSREVMLLNGLAKDNFREAVGICLTSISTTLIHGMQIKCTYIRSVKCIDSSIISISKEGWLASITNILS